MKQLLEEAMRQVVNVVLHDVWNWMNDNFHRHTLLSNCYNCGLYVLSAMCLASWTELSGVRGMTFDTRGVIRANERVRIECTSVYTEEVLKFLGAKKLMCNDSEVLMFIREDNGPAIGRGCACR